MKDGKEPLLSFASIVAVVVASMIGTGVFTTSGFLLADLRDPWRVVLVWFVGGGIASLGALNYGALARRIPESGGEYIFLSKTLHPAIGYAAGWVSLLVGFSAPLAAAAYGFGEYTKAWIPLSSKALGTIVMLSFAGLHGAWVQRGARFQSGAVYLKLILLITFVVYCLFRLSPVEAEPSGPFEISTFAVSLVWVSFSYSGWNAAVYLSGEVRDPERTIPLALIVATATVTLLYVALNVVFVLSAPVAALAGQLNVGRISANFLGGPRLAEVASALIALALATSISSLVMTGPRVYARMAQDGYLPRQLAPKSGPPRFAIALQLVLALGLLWSATYESLLTYIGFTLSLSTAITVVGLVRLRLKEGPGLRVVGWPWVPCAFLLAVLGTAIFTLVRRPTESLGGLLTIAASILFWRLSKGRSRSKP